MHPARATGSGRYLLAIVAVLLLALARPAAAELPDFTSLVKENRAAVVNISTTKDVEVPEGAFEIPGIPEDSPYYDFLRRFFGRELPEQFERSSLGSGFIISADGYLITNHHVVDNAEEIVVRLSDRREFSAEVVGSDELSDIAVVKIDAEGLPPVEFGSGEELEVGEWVVAIGSPFGFEHSATAGIVSAKGRSLPNANYVPFIQTDVAINPGNSGGPLFNLDGKVVGVNAQIVSRTGGYMGISFAIPIEVAMRVVEQLRTQGHVTRGWLGVLIQDVTRGLAQSFGLGEARGAVVTQVTPDSPAERAGLQVGDVIVGFEDRRVNGAGDLPPLVGMTEPGSEVSLEILRDGERREVEVTIGELPEDTGVERAGAAPEDTSEEQRLGLEVSDLSAEQRERLGVEHGALVTAVAPGPARRAGVREGDVILRFGRDEVRDAAHLRELVSELPAGADVVSLLVQRDGSRAFLALELPAEEGG